LPTAWLERQLEVQRGQRSPGDAAAHSVNDRQPIDRPSATNTRPLEVVVSRRRAARARRVLSGGASGTSDSHAASPCRELIQPVRLAPEPLEDAAASAAAAI